MVKPAIPTVYKRYISFFVIGPGLSDIWPHTSAESAGSRHAILALQKLCKIDRNENGLHDMRAGRLAILQVLCWSSAAANLHGFPADPMVQLNRLNL